MNTLIALTGDKDMKMNKNHKAKDTLELEDDNKA